jgi:hypothetical protein
VRLALPGALVVAAVGLAGLGLPAEASAAAASAAAVSTAPVTTAAPRSLGEPTVAGGSAGTVVAATVFASGPAVVGVWSRGSGPWVRRPDLLPTGFVTSYDPAAAVRSDGTVLVVAGASAQSGCITGGSVVLRRLDPAAGVANPAAGVAAPPGAGDVLVDDARVSGHFDDRPAVAAAPAGDVWVSWSQGPDADACQAVGDGDVPMVAVSADGGHRFGAPVALPATAGWSAFGVRVAPTTGGDAVAAWLQTAPMTGGGRAEEAVVQDLHGAELVGPPRVVATGTAPPLVLPGASFYDFPVLDVSALDAGRIALAWPSWSAGRSVVSVAAGTLTGPWTTTTVAPPPGADLLLPALAASGPTALRLVCAVHLRVGDRLGYATALLPAAAGAASTSSVSAVTPDPAGPGFFEIGEELTLSTVGSRLVTAEVVGGAAGAQLQTQSWPLPAVAVTRPPVPARSPLPTRRLADHAAAGARSGSGGGLVAVVVVAVVLAAGGVALRRRGLRRRRAGRRPAAPLSRRR